MKKINLSKKNKKKLIIIGASCAAVLVIAIVAIFLLKPKDNDIPKADNKPNNTTNIPEVKKLQIVDENSNSRPFAIMINNISTARPLQSGLQDAYIIYELIAEGGITRYMALFLDQKTERIGSIRSSRHYYLDYALENDAIYVHHGQSPQAASDFKTLKIDRIAVDASKTGWRDNTLTGYNYEHKLFTSMEKLSNGIGTKRTIRKGDLLLDYSIDSIDMASIKGAEAANKVNITYSASTTSNYVYDSNAKVYKRLVNGKEHKDYVTKKQYTFKNIITYQVANSAIVGGGKGRQELDNLGTGTGYYISEGYAVPITWEKTSRESKTIYKLKNGQELKVNDGNTFIQIQPKGQKLTIE